MGWMQYERSRKKVRRVIVWTLFVLLALSFVPIVPYTIVPPISLRIVDESGQPVPGITVQQSWQHYTYQFVSSVSESSADGEGIVHFPERIERFSVAQLIFGELFRLGSFLNPHASFGPSSFFLPRGNVSGHASYRPHEPLPAEMVIKR